MSTASETPLRAKIRDPRLDVFRGLCMLIILIAHIPWNVWSTFIPARYGFSDATEIFVFCSGYASAMAFATIFDRSGFLVGTGRILQRVWQVYWAHVCVFLVTAALMFWADAHFGGDRYTNIELHLRPLAEDPGRHLPGLLTLTWVPNYFDILPMYLVLLAMIPAMVALGRVHRFLPTLVSFALWIIAGQGYFNLPAEPLGERSWFFNPFSWQFIFFLGFAFARGDLPAPGPDRRLLAAAVGLLVLAAPVSCHQGWSCYAGFGTIPILGEIHDWLAPLTDKMHLAPLRVLHFLALAHVCVTLAGPGGAHLRGPVAGWLATIGRQSLAVFMTGLVTAQALGIVLDLAGRTPLTVAAANLTGFAILYAVALVAGWFKGAPWAGKPKAAGRETKTAHHHQTVTGFVSLGRERPTPDQEKPCRTSSEPACLPERAATI